MQNSQRFYVILWRLLPSLTMLLAFLCAIMLSGSHSPFAIILPSLPLLAAFFWLWEISRYWDLVMLAILGIITDVATGLPLGFHASAWLLAALTCWYCIKMADDDRSFFMRWSAAAIAFTAYIVAQSILAWFMGLGLVAMTTLIAQWLVALLLYPLMHALLHRLRHRVYRKVWVYLPADMRIKPVRA